MHGIQGFKNKKWQDMHELTIIIANKTQHIKEGLKWGSAVDIIM